MLKNTISGNGYKGSEARYACTDDGDVGLEGTPDTEVYAAPWGW